MTNRNKIYDRWKMLKIEGELTRAVCFSTLKFMKYLVLKPNILQATFTIGNSSGSSLVMGKYQKEK